MSFSSEPSPVCFEASLSERYEALSRVAQALNAHADPETFFRALPGELREIVKSNSLAIIRRATPTGGASWPVLAVRGRPTAPMPPIVPWEASITQWVCERLEPFVSSDLAQETRFPSTVGFIRSLGNRSLCSLPLATAHGCLGAISFGSNCTDYYGEEEVRFLSLVAGQVAIAMDNALSRHALREAYKELSTLKDQLAREKLYLEDEIRTERNFEEIIGKSAILKRLLKQVETVAPTDSTVLIHGETGTGKELIARALHDLSPRRDHAFVKLNCAAIPTGLLESELFGHERGAFTGAIAQRIGRFELAQHGTVFLDEIGEVPPELQPKLLRVLQEREFERLGSGRTLHSNARLIAATNRDLAAMVRDQSFRSDLFYRLNVFPIHMPALRERPGDIPLLVRHFTEQCARRMKKTIDSIASETMEALVRYDWPGNVRELQNVIERAVILSPGPVLQIVLTEMIPGVAPASAALAAAPPPPAGLGHANGQALEAVERQHILAVLRETRWVLGGPNGAATRLGLKRSTLQFRMKKLGLARPAA